MDSTEYKDKKVQWVMTFHYVNLNDETTQAANVIDLFAGEELAVAA